MSQEALRSPLRRLQRRMDRYRPCRDSSASRERGGDPRSSGSPAPSSPSPSSSSSPGRLKEELLCPVCHEPFREAVTLRCGHNFCRSCLGRAWEAQRGLPSRCCCPLCRENFSSPADLRINHTLDNLVGLLLPREEGEQRRPRGTSTAGAGAALCPLHLEERRFFCLEEKELLCGSCRGSRQHRGHRIRALREAAADLRAKLANMESSLRDKARDFRDMRRSYESISLHNEEESARLERLVKRELEKLHEFLRDEEQEVLGRLREESQRKRELIQGKMEQLEEESQALLNEARKLQADLKEDDYTFLKAHKNRKRRIACTAEEPEAVPSGMLLDVAQYLGSLRYEVWKKMLDTVTAVPFSLDPNSAAGWLQVSEDLSSVTNHGYKLSVTNPERFTSAPCLLGSRGFSEGFHAWEVDLGGLTNWRVGVSRPQPGSDWTFHHESRSGFWYIYHLPGKEPCWASNASRSEAAPGNLRRLRVELDFAEGELSFYDADLRRHLYTFHERFGGTVFPYFYLGEPEDGAQAGTLRICPLRVQIHEDIPT